MVAGTADQVWKQVKIILLDDPVEAPKAFGVVGPTFLHDGQGDDLRR
jgi:hypothetical protein